MPAPTSPAHEPSGLEHRNRWLTLGLPTAISLLLWGVCWVFSGTRVAWEVLIAAGASMFVVGSWTVFGAAFVPGLTLDTWHLAVIVAYMGVYLSFVYAFNLDLFERLPNVGDYFRRIRLGAKQSLSAHRWIRRLATVGVALFVLSPLPGSGSLGGCVVGRLLGLGSVRTFLASGLASVAVAFLYASIGRPLEDLLGDKSVGFRLALLAAVLVLVVVLVQVMRRFAAKVPSETPR